MHCDAGQRFKKLILYLISPFHDHLVLFDLQAVLRSAILLWQTLYKHKPTIKPKSYETIQTNI